MQAHASGIRIGAPNMFIYIVPLLETHAEQLYHDVFLQRLGLGMVPTSWSWSSWWHASFGSKLVQKNAHGDIWVGVAPAVSSRFSGIKLRGPAFWAVREEETRRKWMVSPFSSRNITLLSIKPGRLATGFGSEGHLIQAKSWRKAQNFENHLTSKEKSISSSVKPVLV
jgi:hypothetical protein